MLKKISIIGVPMDLGQELRGVDLGPDAIRSLGLINRLKQQSHDVFDWGNIFIDNSSSLINDPRLRNIEPIINGCKQYLSLLEREIIAGQFPLILGGDHSIALGTLAGLGKHYQNLGVIWYDAHGDINTFETSPSGNIHGMPLASSLGYGDKRLVMLGGYTPKVKPENVVLIGTRSLDEGEKTLINKLNIKVFTMDDIHTLGINKVIEQTIDYLNHCDGIHLSLDLDGLDPIDAPGVGIKVADGISFNDSVQAMKMLASKHIITSAEFVEVNPNLDHNNQTSKVAVELICTLLGA